MSVSFIVASHWKTSGEHRSFDLIAMYAYLFETGTLQDFSTSYLRRPWRRVGCIYKRKRNESGSNACALVEIHWTEFIIHEREYSKYV